MNLTLYRKLRQVPESKIVSFFAGCRGQVARPDEISPDNKGNRCPKNNQAPGRHNPGVLSYITGVGCHNPAHRANT
jgi:hypothetical protein